MSAAAGWYDDPEMVNTRRYWDGSAWTEHRQEKAAVATQGRTCPYCASGMSISAERCASCGGQLYYCHKDAAWVGVRTKSINVGLLRGGRRDQHRCMNCNRVVAGPKF